MPSRRRPATPASLRSTCPIACTLDLIGDRWTLLVVRDLILGKSRYGEFADGPEGIPTNILAERLVRLEAAGIIRSSPYQQKPVRYIYRLTAKGLALKPVLAALGLWGKKHVAGTKIPTAMKTALAGK